MTKRIFTLALATIICIVLAFAVTLADSDDISVYLDGRRLEFDVPPQLMNDRTMVPLRAVFEAMGAHVDWDGETETVTGTKGDTVVVLTIGDTSPTINGQAVAIDQPGVIVNSRTLAPLRFVGEAFGGIVDWDGETQTVTITSSGGEATQPTNALQPTPTPATSATQVQANIEKEKMRFGGIDWLVLEVSDGKALLLSEQLLEPGRYNDRWDQVTWRSCSLRWYLNGDFYDKTFSEAEKSRIAETTVINNDNQWYGTPGGSDTTDKIFILSIEEVVKYFGDSGQLKNRPSDSRAWTMIIPITISPFTNQAAR